MPTILTIHCRKNAGINILQQLKLQNFNFYQNCRSLRTLLERTVTKFMDTVLYKNRTKFIAYRTIFC